MGFMRHAWVAVAFVAFGEACGTEPPETPTSSGGTPATGGQPTSGGTVPASGGIPGTGGTAPATGGKATGGTPTGGTASGGKASGGTATGGSASGGKATGGASTGGSGGRPKFILGADISSVDEGMDRGNRYADTDGTTKSIFDVLKNHGFNYIRLRAFVKPGAMYGYAFGTGGCCI